MPDQAQPAPARAARGVTPPRRGEAGRHERRRASSSACATPLAERQPPRPLGAAGPTHDGQSADGTWLELVGGGRPRGGRGRQRDPDAVRARRHERGAGVRAGRRGARRAPGRRRARRSCGPTCRRATRCRRVAAVDDARDGARPSPGVRPARRSASCRRAWSTSRTGRTPGRRTSRCCASAAGSSSGRRGAGIGERPGDVVLALDPGMAFGTGLHPTTRLCLAGIERWADDGRLDGGRAPRRRRAARASSRSRRPGSARPSVLGVDTDPIADRGDRGNARRNRARRAGSARARARVPTRRAGPFDLVLANLIASVLVAPRRATSHAELAARRAAPRVGHLRRPRGRGARRRSRRPGSRWSARPRGEWVAARGGPRLTVGAARRRASMSGAGRPPLQSRRRPSRTPAAPPILLPSTSRWRSPAACPRSCCRWCCALAGRRPSRRVASCAACS